MDDRSESSDEIEVSPKDSDDCESTSQDNSEDSSSSALSVQQDTFENQQPPCDIPSETSLPSTSTSTSQALNTDQLDEICSIHEHADICSVENDRRDQSPLELEPTSNSQIVATDDCQPCIGEIGETQSSLNTTHSGTEIQMLESSPSRPVFENPNVDLPKGLFSGTETQRFKTSSSIVFSNSPTPEQSSSTNINVPRRDLKFVTNKEKERTDQNRSDSSPSTSKRNIEPKSESEEFLSNIKKMLPSPQFKKGLNPVNIKDSEVPKIKNDPLLQRQHFGSISSEASRSREQSEVGMDLDTPYLDVHEGQPSTSSYQPVVADVSSAGDGLNSSSGVAAFGEARVGVIESDTSSIRISKYISNARKLLLTVLEEIMKFNEEKSTYRRISKLFLHISELSHYDTERRLFAELLKYLTKNKWALDEENAVAPCPITGRYTQGAYDALGRIVVASLISTLSMLSRRNFDYMMANYKALKGLYERCSQFWRDDNEEIPDEDSRNRVAFLKIMTQRLLLQTRNAFRELLVYIGEHAEGRIVDSYEESLWEEDKNFLRQFL